MNLNLAFCALTIVALLSACATVRPCPPEGLAATQCRAARNDKPAQLALAKVYENGTGGTQDWRRAADLYQAAAARRSGTIYVYSPGVGNARGQVIPIRVGADQPGLPEAAYRLGIMYRNGRGVERDEKKASDLIERAMKEGYIPK